MVATIFQGFRIMFGMIIAGFVIYFFLSYAGIYGQTEENKIKADILKNFKTAAGDVYKTGIPYSFTQFGESGFEFELSFDTEYNPTVHYPGIRSIIGTTPLLIPMLLLPGDEVYLHRESVDLGWWNFYFIEALSDTAVIFVPMDSGASDVVKDIVAALPSTGQTDRPKVTFGFCDGSELSYEELCSGHRCERYGFQGIIDGYGEASSKCTASLPTIATNPRLVTISQGCSTTYVSSGVCIMPPDTSGIGEAYIAGSSKKYIYKNMLDLIALITGGDEDTIYGITGENFYEYENRMFTEFIATASELMAKRAELIAGELETDAQCLSHYSDLTAALTSINNMLVSSPEYYQNSGSVSSLLFLLDEADSQYQSLVNKGCEVFT